MRKKAIAGSTAALLALITILLPASAQAIVGGVPATKTDAPWQAIVTAAGKLCGGVVISDKDIATAAHCVNEADASTINVRLGAATTEDLLRSPYLSVTAVTIHPNWQKGSGYYDIAILRLEKTIEEQPTIHRIDLPSAEDGQTWAQGDSPARVAGWGSTTGNPSSTSRNLNVADVNILRGACTGYGLEFDQDLNMCAGITGGGVDACQGDSGGALAAPTSGAKWTLAGLVSFGRECGSSDFPGVYVNVASLMPWIEAAAPAVSVLNPPGSVAVLAIPRTATVMWRAVPDAVAYEVTSWPGKAKCQTSAGTCTLKVTARTKQVMVVAIDSDGDRSAPVITST